MSVVLAHRGFSGWTKDECCVWPTEGSVVGLTTAERREVTERVLCEMKATGLPFHVYKLHQVILL